MSLRGRLRRATKGKDLPTIYRDIPGQTKRIIQQINDSLSEAKSYYNEITPTREEWDRLRQNDIFKDEADYQYIYSFDAFVEAFGTCPKGCKHLYKLNRHHTTWTKHNTEWGRYTQTKKET